MTSTRTRSLGGCATCRTRHVKCDETKPRCLVCDHDGVACLGYEIRVSFDTTDEAGAVKFRRPLYSLSEQKRQTLLLSESLQHKSAQGLLNRIDKDCERIGDETYFTLDVQYGPFGAFKTAQVGQEEFNALYDDSQSTDTSSYSLGMPSDDLPETVLQEPEHRSEGRDVETSQIGVPFACSSPEMAGLPEFSSTIDLNLFMSCCQGEQNRIHMALEPTLCPPLDLTVSGDLCVRPEVASLLVSNFREAVIPCFSLFPFRKTPWHVIVLPNSINTLGALSLGDQPNNSNLATFYAVLSMSAFSLGNSELGVRRTFWARRGQHYRSKANHYLQMSLYDALSVQKIAKYKENLTALLTMVTVSMFSEEWGQTERYLVEAENLIRLRGLPKTRKSRKIRLLHHCYTYMRLFYESMFTLSNDMCLPNGQLDSISSETSMATSFSTFRLGPWNSDLRQKMLEAKSFSLGENDLLLEHPGRWDSTMYPSIFGVPEDLLFLISQVVRLGNEKDISETVPHASPLTVSEFTKRAKILERCVCDWRPPSNFFPERDDLRVDQSLIQASFNVLHELLLALHNALTIYFYRRIYDIDAALLQEKVKEIVKCITRCEHESENAGLLKCNTPFIWPALVGACEALGSDIQEHFANWFQTCHDRSGLRPFTAALEMAREVWAKRSRLGGSEVAWIAILKTHNLRLLYM